ncbi:Mu transposase C-terminal domain-containing protein [Pseudomonas kuykendallii]|uniref:Transposase n=1 Tax=Pseudomonas kuykendallii TaxID=1007099 RepID=A0A2W5EY52_9PSED|nr:Mu transposase C-terminal domain-containing protein [Pseudomonas kuykendallii]PZP22269.1 MAG: transposase [Pseudomonas kuykendallii]
MSNLICVGATVEVSGIPFFIKAMRVDLRDIVLTGKGGVERTLDFRDFYNQLATGQIQFPGHVVNPGKRNWRPSEYAEAVYRKALVELADSASYSKASDDKRQQLLAGLAEKSGKPVPTSKSVKSYQRKYAAGGFEALIPNFGRRGGTGWTTKSRQKALANQIILDTYAKDDKINLAALAVIVNDALKEEKDANGKPLSLSVKTLSRMIHRMPRELVLSRRMDPRTYRLLSRQAVNEFYVEHAFQLMQVDAKTIDMYCVDALGLRYTEITLYAMVCSRTGFPVGLYVTPGAPSEYTLLKLFEFFFSPKDEAFKQRFGLQTDWPAPCGLGQILFDNATENTGGVSLEIVRDLGADIHYARAFRGDDKPNVESDFKALDEYVFKRMPGAKNSSQKGVNDRHERAEQEACYSVEEVYRDLVQFVGDVYVHQPRQKLGFRYKRSTTIKQAMDEELSRFMPPPPPSLEQVKRLILQKNRETRRVQHYGIDFESFQYHSYEFAALAREYALQEVTILFNPSDCSAIYAVNPKTDELIKLHCKLKDVPAVSFEVVKVLRQAYGRPTDEMQGHDYQRVYAQLLQKWTTDSQKNGKRKIKENNKQARQQEREKHHAEVNEQLQRGLAKSPVPMAFTPLADDEEAFEPAPREDLSHE